MLLVSMSPKFHSITSCRLTGHFETNALNDPKMTLNNTRSGTPYISVTSVLKS